MGDQDKLMLRITASLERRPVVNVPEDFAARVMARVPARPVRARMPMMVVRQRYGVMALRAAVVVLLVTMLVIAAVFGRSSSWSLLELTCLVEMAGLVLWMGLGRRRI